MPYFVPGHMATILITGASGLIGRALAAFLSQQGHVIHRLGRCGDGLADPLTFHWDIIQGTIDERCLHGVTHVVHLAGAGIADARWKAARVQELIDSRAASSHLLLHAVRRTGTPVRTIVSAAGINYYGAHTTDRLFAETDEAGKDTIARISVAWEQAVDEWGATARVVKLRTPVVLARTGGALGKLAYPVRWGLGAVLGHGRQWMPWVHIDDLVSAYATALFNEDWGGAYNVNTGNDVSNARFMRTIARVLHRPFLLPNVPGFALRIALGEMSTILLEGSRADNRRLLSTGFRFRHPELEPALRNLLRYTISH